MLSIYLAALLLLGAASLVGQAVLWVAGARAWSWLAPAVGLATLIVLETVAIRLPGRGTAAVAITLVLLLVATGVLVWRTTWAVPWRPAIVCVTPILASALPFIAQNRVGLLGTSFDNDMASHLIWVQSLLSAHIQALYGFAPGYPLGPHSVVATLVSVTGLRTDYAFDGFLILVLPVTALTAATAVKATALWRRALIGLLVSIAYLAAAYYGEASFKEPLMALLLLAFVVYARELASPGAERRSVVGWLRACIPAGLFVAAAVDSYSDVALGWFAAFLGIWAAGELIARPRLVLAPRQHLSALRRGLFVALGAAAVVLIFLAPTLGRIITYAKVLGTSPAATGAILKGQLGNLAGPLSPYEALGVWLQSDFRFLPANAFHAGELGAVALAALLFGVFWSLRRRDIALPALVAACAAIYWYTNRTQSPYVTAKTLMVASPAVMLLSARALLVGREEDTGPRRGTMLRTVCGIAFAAVALFSSSLVLRASHVMPQEPVNELAIIRPLVGSQPTLFLGNDDFVAWELRGVNLAYFDDASTISPTIELTGLAEPWSYGQPLDFDSIPAGQLDRFRYVITPSGDYASEPPSNFRLVRAQRLYDLWQRTGVTPERELIPTPGAPGAVVDCHVAAGRHFAHRVGIAATFAAPVFAGPLAYVPAGTSASAGIALPKGAWNISVEYSSSETLLITVGSAHFTMPPNLSRPGPFYAVGTLHSPGGHPLEVSIYEVHPSRFASSQDIGVVTALVATRDPDPEVLVPLAKSCGHYVEWYQSPR